MVGLLTPLDGIILGLLGLLIAGLLASAACPANCLSAPPPVGPALYERAPNLCGIDVGDLMLPRLL